MRIRIFVLISAVLLISSGVGMAQEAPQTPTPGRSSSSAFMSPKVGRVDFGFRASTIDGDTAKFQRYRDLRDGAYLDAFRFEKEQENWVFNAAADNVGYRDQQYLGAFNSGKVKASFEWNQVPLFLGADTQSLYTYEGNGVFTIDDAIQQQIQSDPSTNKAPLFRSFLGRANAFDTRSRSDNALFGLVVSPTRELDISVDVKSKRRDGSTVFNGNFAFTNAIELAVPLDDRTTDVNAMAEWASERGRVSVGYTGSWYDNNVASLTFDNPFRFSDIAGTPSRGRTAYWPSSTAHSFNTGGSVALPAKSRVNAFVSIGTWKQDADLLPATINNALALETLERSTAEAEARIIATNFNFNTRPSRYVWLNVRYRYYDYDNRTPVFDIRNMVVGDQTLGAAQESEPMSITRHNFDVDASFTPSMMAGFKVGYGREVADRTFRVFEQTIDDVFRVSGDLTGNQYVSVRGVFEHSQRTGSGFDEELLADVGEHDEMRHFDIADRGRNRGTVILTVTPISALGFNASIGAGKDNYKNSGFGLRDNEHRVYSAGFDVVPNDQVDANLTYGYEKYTALQWSRTANPPSATDVTFFDERRDWGIDSGDKVRTLSAALGLMKLVPKTEVQLTYDYSWSKATYLYVVPAVSVIAAPRQLPPVDNRLAAFKTDARYFLTRNVAVGVVYLYDRYRVNDYALSPDTVNSLYPLNATGGGASAIYLNYLYRPYTAHTAWVRLTYLW